MDLTKLKQVLVITICLLGQSCAVVSYGIRPKTAWDSDKIESQEGEFTYFIERKTGGIALSNREDLIDSFEASIPYTKINRMVDEPKQGKYVRVTAEYILDGVVGLGWLYVAACTLFILPAYSGGTGIYMRYAIINDSQNIKTYEYKIERKAFAWLPVLLFAWANFITDSEKDAIEATSRQFFVDAKKDELL